MDVKKLLPDPELSIEKYGRLYKFEDVIKETQKNRRQTGMAYLLLTFLFLLSAGTILCRNFQGNNGEADLIAITLLFGALFFLVYRTRYSRIEKQVRKTREAIIEDVPEFIDKVVLLLNAGMVTEAALIKIAEDYERSLEVTGRRALYDGLSGTVTRIRATNSLLQRELSEFAVRSGVRELMRFSAIVEDNLNKGSSLVEKLEGEGALLWMGRKKRAEERARLAETKLSLPLMLLLTSLILVTTAPMLLGM